MATWPPRMFLFCSSAPMLCKHAVPCWWHQNLVTWWSELLQCELLQCTATRVTYCSAHTVQLKHAACHNIVKP
jgi:hypothetical protein